MFKMNELGTMKIAQGLQCPMCTNIGKFLLNWTFSGLNDSVFNYLAEFYSCEHCGLVWIANISDEKLLRFYTDECSYFENSHFDIKAVENIKKFNHYKNVLEEIGRDCSVVDVGCGRGGFISWLMNNNWGGKGCGIDVDVKSLPKNKNSDQLVFIEGHAKALPFEDNTQSILTYFHVLEHICNINEVLEEAHRVLETNGYLVIEVPDAQEYESNSVSTGFWPSIREHIYHYSPKGLADALVKNGFYVEKIQHTLLPTPEFSYPSLIVVAQKTDKKNKCNIQDKSEIGKFFKETYKALQERSAQLVKELKLYDEVVMWGVSNQLLSLMPLLLFDLANVRICDVSPKKQNSTWNGLAIESPEDCYSEGSCLVISSYLHQKNICLDAKKIGWQNENIYYLV